MPDVTPDNPRRRGAGARPLTPAPLLGPTLLGPNRRVVALPSRSRPRLLVAGDSPAQRWRAARLYPASRPSARMFRWLLRALAAVRRGQPANTDDAPLAAAPLLEFIDRVWPSAAPSAVLIGTPGPAQKLTVQVRHPTGELAGYLKVVALEPARHRLRREARILPDVPEGLGPELLANEDLGSFEALALSPLPGHPLPAHRPPRALPALLEALHRGESLPAAQHPWLLRLQTQRDQGEQDKHARRPDLTPWLEALGDHRWAVVLQHGDLAPWNLLRNAAGQLTAIDWEHGSARGMEHMDLAHYLLQMAMLIQRRSPVRARAEACRFFQRQPWPGLAPAEADAVVNLAAYGTYLEAAVDGIDEQAYQQRWRRQVWESSACDD